ncbi:MAG: succinylglutamate desuccinylase/aspartoacylase family protein, partial [Sinomicrobium sp.]|nr:succinylglutamate desuccinylase/aspartoacylase family protein [Sinomicrobium sp.]
KGSVYAVSGNLPALLKGVRFIEQDLNRIWTEEIVEKIRYAKPEALSAEEREAQALYKIILELLERHSGPFYFIDFHTTSSKTIPFITISDSLINRKFSAFFPVPVVLGIEEYLQGALLSYANQLGYVALAFESGQHEEQETIAHTIAFIYLSLVCCGCLPMEEIAGYETYVNVLKTAAKGKDMLYEVTGSYRVGKDEDFKMIPGFRSFQKVAKGAVLAKSNGSPVRAKKGTTLFMPLYQSQGSEGFFTIREIPKFFLKLSAWVRNSRLDGLLTLLPGVSWETAAKETLLVNLNVARFLTKPFFHLLGYRSWQVDKDHIRMVNRERRAKTGTYKKEVWYSKHHT